MARKPMHAVGRLQKAMHASPRHGQQTRGASHGVHYRNQGVADRSRDVENSARSDRN
jgi:hypothetical protein